MLQLDPHQEEGVEFLLSKPRLFLLDNTGVGKTIEAIEAHRRVGQKPGGSKAVVFCENNKLFDWAEEYKTWHPHCRRYMVRGTPANRQKQYNAFNSAPGDCVLIINHHKVFPDLQEMLKLEYEISIVDEADVLNNAQNKIHTQLKFVLQKHPRLWQLTATPFGTNLLQFYNLFEISGLALDLFGTPHDFIAKYCVVERKTFRIRGRRIVKNEIVGAKNIKDFREKVRPFCLRRSIKYSGTSFSAISCGMTKNQAKIYRAAKRNKLATMTRKERFEPISRYAFITQILDCPRLIDPNEPNESPKLDAAIERFRKVQEKVVVFSQFKKWHPEIIKRFEEDGVTVFQYSGDQSPKRKHEAEVAFREHEEPCVMVVTSAACKGINLQHAHRMFILDFLFNPVLMLQLFGRMDRRVQKNSVAYEYFIVEDTHEEKIFSRLHERQDLLDKVLDSDNAAMFDLQKIFEDTLRESL
jgi:SNF2 family DNA or RNA helicase